MGIANVALALLVLAVGVHSAGAQNPIVPAEKSRRTGCRVVLGAPGIGFPAGGTVRGVTCGDGSPCDADGQVNGVCQIPAQVCVNWPDPSCPAAEMKSVSIKAVGKARKRDDVQAQVAALQAATDAIGFPTSANACSEPVDIPVAVDGPNKKGVVSEGRLELQLKGKPKVQGKVKLVCRPTNPPTPGASTTSTTTSTTLPTGPVGEPGEGLRATLLGATVGADGVVTARLQLTDDAGVAVTPVTGTTTNPDQARVRLTIARLDVVSQTVEGLTTSFTRYRNYITVAQTGQPTYDSGGTFAVEDPSAGIWTYTFRTALPAGYDGTLTHTIAAQVERTVGESVLVANPLLDFVPAGGAVATVREVVTTQQCNTCHDPLQAHGGGRREVKLCQLCHTDQGIDPDTGNSIDFLDMVHRIHRGSGLPNVANGAVGAEYTIVGYRGERHTYARKLKACSTLSGGGNGPFTGLPCSTDADCANGVGGNTSTCTSTVSTGVGFPRDMRGSCESCHAQGATRANYLESPSTAACGSCHSDINPGEVATLAGPPGTGHVAGAQPETLCRLCHPASGVAFDNSVGGAHTTPARAPELTGIVAEILGVSGPGGGAVAAGSAVTVQFRLKNSAGTPYTNYAAAPAFTRIAFAMSGPTTDFGGASTPVITGTAFGSGSNGTLVPPDGAGVASYTFATALPALASGSWRVGIEARRSVTVTTDVDPIQGDTPTTSVTEAARNVVLDFSVDGSAVVARRQVVEQAKCDTCHGTFSVDFSIHGSLRNQVDYCVVCHNPNVTDAGVRDDVVTLGAGQQTESVHMKVLIHKTHTGEELDQRLYIVYGNRSRPVDLGEVRFPGNRRDCETCHRPGTFLLPLPEGVLPTRLSTTTGPGVENVTGSRPPVQSACLSCHDTGDAATHAALNTLNGTEACHVCHGEGRVVAVSGVHSAEE